MFPSNLHKSILQLDRQISLLENECKNMEVDKKKKSLKPEVSQTKCIKAVNPQLKSPSKIALKKLACDASKRTKKITQPFSARVRSSSSVQSNCSKPWSEIGDVLPEKKIKSLKMNANPHSYPSLKSGCADFQSQTKSEDVAMKWMNARNDALLNIPEKESKILENDSNCCGDVKQDHILHKEVIFSNSGERIEVTVTQKSGDTKENMIFKKKNDLKNISNRGANNCNCQSKRQKWSDILSLDPVKKKTTMNNSLGQSTTDETQTVYQPFCCAISKVLSEKVLTGSCSNDDKMSNIGNTDTLKRFIHPVHKLPKATTFINKPEKETQCYLDKNESKESLNQSSRTNKVSPVLVNELDHKSNGEKKKTMSNMEILTEKLTLKDPASLYKKLLEDNKMEALCESINAKNDFLFITKQQLENSAKERELLTRELSAKENVISTMQKREEEYLSVISNLKLNLEKVKASAQQEVNTNKELGLIKGKFLEQSKFNCGENLNSTDNKVFEVLKKSYSKIQKVLERYVLENDKLKTRIQIYKLESQKHDVLLAGKEAEIKKYKEEISNFQRQISEHLAALKSNAQTIDIEKMMETIMQQTQNFIVKDPDSAESELSDSSKQLNGLMHSSPTSTKTSVVNSSWKRISSIRENDHSLLNSENLSNPNDSNEKEFFQIFGESPSERKSSNKVTENLLKRLLDNEAVVKDSSFNSCISIHDDGKDDVDHCELEDSKNDVTAKKDKTSSELPSKSLSAEKVQSNIEELFKKMKLKWSNEIRGVSPENCTIDDFLNSSQISSISVTSSHPPLVNSPK